MLDLGILRVFARIVDIGSISGAARALGMPKSSVSRALVRLEEALGAVLVERSTRRLRLTDAGLLLHRHAGRILDDVGEAENAIGGLVGKPSGTLRVSVGFTFAAGPLAPMLPGVPATVEDLLGHTLIAHAEGGAPWRIRTPTGTLRELRTQPGAVIPEPAVVKTMLIAGAGIGWLPDFHASDALADGSLVRVLPDHPAETLVVHALYPSHRSLSAKVRVFIDSMASHLAPRR